MNERRFAARNDAYARELESYFRSFLVDDYASRALSVWDRDYSDAAAYARSVAPQREAWHQLLSPPELEPIGAARIGGEWLEGADSWWIELPLAGGLTAQAGLAVPDGGAEKLVVFQHGLGSAPERAFGVGDPDGVYDVVGRRLLAAGYAVLAPMNLTQIAPRNRAQRLARLAGTTVEGLELARLLLLLDVVSARFDLDSNAVGFWGSSWGGLAVQMWTPLSERFTVAVSSGFFNDRAAKMVVQDTRYVTFEDTSEDHAFLPGHLTAFGDADLASLICPRPFLVQIGKRDSIAWWPQVVEEYERARTHWKQLGLDSYIDLDLHSEGHVVRAEPGVEWLRRWL
ncbi:hypothetical protein ACT3SQ_04350 [Brachybacterium sp. AOP42-C2-15]|uniref:hypothetical protein n=1 Tax=unclassified Brachybacterium TaxID=2623841 RepID=UPI0040349B3C